MAGDTPLPSHPEVPMFGQLRRLAVGGNPFARMSANGREAGVTRETESIKGAEERQRAASQANSISANWNSGTSQLEEPQNGLITNFITNLGIYCDS